MNSKEIIKRLIAHDAPERIGYNFHNEHNDIIFTASRRYKNLEKNPYDKWGIYPELSELSSFKGETRKDIYGNIYGRFNEKTNGECVYGAIQDWEKDEYILPESDPEFFKELKQQNFAGNDKFIIATGESIFSSFRDARLMTNALADTIEEPERVKDFVDRLTEYECEVIRSISGCGIDGWMLWDDWGTEDRTFISPNSFRELFKPAYHRLAQAAHEAGMSIILHSCGYIYDFMEDLIEAGIDVFQFDQPDNYPTEVLVRDFASRVCFYSPVDIQKVLPSGNREMIETRAKEMCELFRSAGGEAG